MKVRPPAPGGPDGDGRRSSGLWSAIGLSVIGRYGAYAANMVTLMVLARLFAPEHFGVIAAVQVAYTFGMILAESGLGPAVVNLERLSPRDRDGVYSVTVLLGIAAAALLYLATPGFVAFYGEERLAIVTPFVAFALAFAGASIMPVAQLQRERRFIVIGASEAMAEIVSSGASVVLLITGGDPIVALAIRMPLRMFLRWFGTYVASASTAFGRPRLGTHLGAVRPMLGFSLHQFGFSVVNFFARNLDQILVGRLLGATALGVYERTYQLMRYPLLLMTLAMAPAIQPVVRTLRDDPAEVVRLHVQLTRFLAWGGVVASAVAVLGAEVIVSVVLGPAWGDVVGVLRVLGVAIAVQVVTSSSGAFFQAFGNTRLMFFDGIASTVVMIAAMVLGLRDGSLEQLAAALAVAFHLNAAKTFWLLYRHVFRASPRPFFASMTVPLLLIALLAVSAGRLTS